MSIFDLNKLIRPNVAAMKPYSSARDEFKEIDAQMVFLDANENPFQNGVNRYPDPQQRDVKELLAKQRMLPMDCLLYTSPSPRDATLSRMPSSA